MQDTTIHIKTDIATRDNAKQVAEGFGLTLTGLVNAMLKQVSRTKQLELSLDETPSPWMIEALRQAEEEVQAGKELTFPSTQDALNYIQSLIDDNAATA